MRKNKNQPSSGRKDFFSHFAQDKNKFNLVKTFKNEDNIFTFNVSKCPIYDLAEKTGMHEWLYHMGCSTDFYSTPSFSKEIGFTRTKSLMQGDECCNHTYYYKSKIQIQDSILGYCGLYCGACPNYQNTNGPVISIT